MIRYAILLLAGLLAMAPGLTLAQDLDKGVAATLQGDYATALAELRPLAKQGDARAQYYLAKLYHEGHGVSYDPQQAVSWYERAAAGGEWTAALELGGLYWGQSLEGATGQSAADGGLVRAHMWFGIAAEMELAGCVDLSATMRDAVAQSMTAEEVARADALARAWLAEHEPTGADVAAAKSGC